MGVNAMRVDDRAELNGVTGAFQFFGLYGREGIGGMIFVCPCGCGKE